jgi:hypothetical protein
MRLLSYLKYSCNDESANTFRSLELGLILSEEPKYKEIVIGIILHFYQSFHLLFLYTWVLHLILNLALMI